MYLILLEGARVEHNGRPRLRLFFGRWLRFCVPFSLAVHDESARTRNAHITRARAGTSHTHTHIETHTHTHTQDVHTHTHIDTHIDTWHYTD